MKRLSSKPLSSQSVAIMLWIAYCLVMLASCSKTNNSPSGSPAGNGSNPPPAPVIYSFRPAAAVPGDTLTLFGKNFDPDVHNNTVLFDSVKADLLGASPDSLMVIVPQNIGDPAVITVIVGHRSPLVGGWFHVGRGSWSPDQYSIFYAENSNSFTIGNRIYLLGGLDNLRNPIPGYRVCTPGNASWEYKQEGPLPARSSGIAFSIGNKGYYGLGTDEKGNYLNDFYEFDPASGSWTRKADLPGGPRFGAISFSVNGRGYAGLGLADAGEKNDFWSYDPGANAWTRLKDFTDYNIVGASACAAGGKGYLLFGYHAYQGPITLADKFWSYDPASDLWQALPVFPGYRRTEGMAFAFGNKIYAGLGAHSNQNDFWEYDIEKSQWVRKHDLYFANSFSYFPIWRGLTGAAINNRIFIGFSAYNYNDDYAFDLLEFTP